MTISEWLRQAVSALTQAECPDAAVDARWMVEDALRMTRSDLIFEGDLSIEPAALNTLDGMLRRRLAGEPVQYILGSADFMGLRFFVDERVLIPRQDTETLVEAALIDVRGLHQCRVLDLCTGSGCVGLSVKSLAPQARVTLTDISRDALEVARKNADALGLDVTLRRGDLFEAVGRERFDVVTANPPYIPRAELPQLQREVRFEPAMALSGGDDGLDFYRRIAEGVSRHLTPGGALYLEVGAGQAGDVRALLERCNDGAGTGAIKDLNGIERVVWLKL